MTPVQTAPSVTPIEERGYAHPEVLVSTQWVADHLRDPKVRLLESDEDLLLYEIGHIPGALKIDWVGDLNDPVTRDYLDTPRLQDLLRAKGISQDTMVVLYGDQNNWWATYAFWVFRLFGPFNLKIMDGGRARWEQEGRPMVREVPQYPRGNIVVGPRHDGEIRALRDDVFAHVGAGAPLVDVRSPEEYRGERLHMPDYPNEGAIRGGHIPGAKNVPWARAANPDDGTFKPASDLKAIYEQEIGLKSGDDIVAYCRIGERSSHTWFVLKHLLGYQNVKNYDGSWTEWGNLVGAPVER